MMMKRIVLWIIMLITIMVSGNATELQRDGWNLISVCQDMNASDINLTRIEEIQSQNGRTIYTGQKLRGLTPNRELNLNSSLSKK